MLMAFSFDKSRQLISIVAGITARLIQDLVRLCCVTVLQTLHTGSSNMLTIIFRVILAIIHYVYTNYEKAKSRLKRVGLYCAKIYRRSHFVPKFKSEYENCCQSNSEILELKRTAENVNKLPVHLCILLGPTNEQQIELSHLAQILRWSIAAGIPYVSFYDHDGFLQENQHLLRAECEKSSLTQAECIDWGTKTNLAKLYENGSNGMKRRTRVQIFSHQDGKGEIVKLAQNLSRAVSHGLLKIEEINMELLNDKLRLESAPDPDLALVCAPALCTYGLLPWHTKITEFHHFANHRDVTIQDFSLLLQKYGRCQQRYGK